MESKSDFFVDLFREIGKIQTIVETYSSDYFIRQRFEMVHARDRQIERDQRQGMNLD